MAKKSGGVKARKSSSPERDDQLPLMDRLSPVSFNSERSFRSERSLNIELPSPNSLSRTSLCDNDAANDSINTMATALTSNLDDEDKNSKSATDYTAAREELIEGFSFLTFLTYEDLEVFFVFFHFCLLLPNRLFCFHFKTENCH